MKANGALYEPRLPLFPKPNPTESACGYGLQLAEENRIRNLKRLFALLGLTPSIATALGTQAVYEIASGQKQLDQAELEAATQEADDLAGAQLLTSATRFCPECLRAAGYWRDEWDLPLSFACRLHGLQLVERCPGCGASVSYFKRARWVALACRCGFEFSRAAASPPPPWVDVLDRNFRPWSLRRTRPTLAECRWLDRGASIVLRRLIWEVEGRSGIYMQTPLAKKVRVSPEHHAAIEAITRDWPHGMQQSLAPRVASMTKQSRDDLVKMTRKHAPQSVAAALLQLLHNCGEIKHMPASLRRAANVVPPGAGLVTMHSVEIVLRTFGRPVNRLFNEGLFARATVGLSARTRWVDVEEMQFALWLSRVLPTITQATEFLGCREKLITALAACGYLSTVIDPRLPSVRRVRIVEMAELVRGLARRSSPLGKAGRRRLVLLSEIVPLDPRQAGHWHAFMERIRRREIALFDLGLPVRGLGNFVVPQPLAPIGCVRPLWDGLPTGKRWTN